MGTCPWGQILRLRRQTESVIIQRLTYQRGFPCRDSVWVFRRISVGCFNTDLLQSIICDKLPNFLYLSHKYKYK